MKEIIIREGDSFVTENTLDHYAGKVDSRGVMKQPIVHNGNKKKVYEEANGRRDEESIIYAWQRLKGHRVTLMSLDVQMGLCITNSFLFILLTKIPDYRTTLSDHEYTAKKSDVEYKIQRLAEKEISLVKSYKREDYLLAKVDVDLRETTAPRLNQLATSLSEGQRVPEM
ncbi:hypothetical protein HYALB_00012423 [Hymenoscyphus albidus]|uniref:Uncharacterized protein n=1 Tax=Hymenoscyphus albidus TaxID=595503 RepID=A0A9N9LU82_9HELO|nr:hypothetical protein HYALB_00012423 [Hymenoscyphus albidus]